MSSTSSLAGGDNEEAARGARRLWSPTQTYDKPVGLTRRGRIGVNLGGMISRHIVAVEAKKLGTEGCGQIPAEPLDLGKNRKSVIRGRGPGEGGASNLRAGVFSISPARSQRGAPHSTQARPLAMVRREPQVRGESPPGGAGGGGAPSPPGWSLHGASSMALSRWCPSHADRVWGVACAPLGGPRKSLSPGLLQPVGGGGGAGGGVGTPPHPRMARHVFVFP